MNGTIAAIGLAAIAGYNVYSSCTTFRDIRKTALTIDVIGTVTVAMFMHWMGAWS